MSFGADSNTKGPSTVGKSTMNAVLLYESDHLVVVYQPGITQSVVVTFNEMGLRVKGLAFWADKFLLAEGHPAIGIVSKYPHWFPRLYTIDALELVLEQVRASAFERVTTYGFSQGGYAALKFSAHLGASKSISFSPQSSIAPLDVSHFDTAFASHYSSRLHDDMRITSADLCARNFILYDPFHTPDLKHLSAISAVGSTTPIPVPFAAHYTANYCAETRIMADVFRALHASDGSGARGATRLIKGARRTSPRYWSGRVQAMNNLRTRWTSSHFEACQHALAHNPNDASTLFSLAELHLAIDQPNECISLLTSFVARADSTPLFFLLKAWTRLRALKEHTAELCLIEAAIQNNPKNAFVRLHYVITLRGLERHEDEIAQLELTELDAGNNAAIWSQIADQWSLSKVAERACAASRKTVELSKSDKNAWLRHGTRCHNANLIGESISAIERAIELDPRDANLKLTLASYCMDEKEGRPITSTILEAINLDTRSIPIRIQAIRLFIRRNMNTLAVDVVTSFRRLYPSDAEGLLQLLNVFTFTYSKFIADIFEMLPPPSPTESAKSVSIRGFIHERLNHYPEATAAMRKAVSMEPETLEYRVYLASLLLKSKKIKEAHLIAKTINLEEVHVALRPLLEELPTKKGNALPYLAQEKPDRPTLWRRLLLK